MGPSLLTIVGRQAGLELRMFGADSVGFFGKGPWDLCPGQERDWQWSGVEIRIIKSSGVNGLPPRPPPPRRKTVVGGPGEGMHYFGRGQLKVDDGEGRLEERGASWRNGVEDPSLALACCWQLLPRFDTPSLHSHSLPGISWPLPLGNHHTLTPLASCPSLALPHLSLWLPGKTLALGSQLSRS